MGDGLFMSLVDGPFPPFAICDLPYTPGVLVDAYSNGIFPWPDSQGQRIWACPDPRWVIPVGALHISRSLARATRKPGWTTSLNQAFDQVVYHCSDRPETWMVPELIEAYRGLHNLGFAYSIESWYEGELAGGLLAIRISRSVVIGESMVSLRTNGSKIAMMATMRWLEQTGGELMDVQNHTPHLERMGAVEMSHATYMDILRRGPLPRSIPGGLT